MIVLSFVILLQVDTLNVEVKESVRQWRDVVIERRAYNLAWAKGITGKWVEFPRENDKSVFGLEFTVPLRFSEVKGIYKSMVIDFAKKDGSEVSEEQLEESYEELKDKTWYEDSRVPLPPNIKRIRVISLSPQEVLPKRKRTIDSKLNIWNEEATPILLTRQYTDIRLPGYDGLEQKTEGMIADDRLHALKDILHEVLIDKSERKEFGKEVTQPEIEEILIIAAHGGYDNTIGEQDKTVKPLKTHIEGKEVNLSEKQAEGNWLDINHVIKKYDKNPKIGAVLSYACYLGRDDLSGHKYRSVVYRIQGKSGILNSPLSVFLRNRTLASR